MYRKLHPCIAYEVVIIWHTVKKEMCHFSLPQKRPVEDSDWRKNVEAMSGMEGRKKMFDAAKGSAQ